ncbi:sulfatase [Psychromarinibacter sp. C21-152]|uniref:Sulfatase n=1 Tax=Psychromarinibacter sediminicola TaxID=3033385 RepID=A0AAE3T8E7_9RHOB|nr:sulfatase [Psychromarinibacter sediminicola]MDF0599994.1 sulfatase [Psychromarinibacter sediminicola]
MRTVLVLLDSLNRLALGAYGGTEVATPNIDRFAARALTFDSHYVGSLPCMPARRDLHTGRLNFMHRSWGPLEPFDNSMPRSLGQAGTYTHLVTDHFHYFEDGGANYHTRYATWDLVRGQEYDTWKAKVAPDLERYGREFSDRHYNDGARTRLQHQINRDHIRDEADHPGPQCFDKALEFLDENREAQDWLLQIECFDPHEPFFVPEGYKAALPPSGYDGPVLDWPRYGPCDDTPEEIAEIRRNYHALVAMCDAHFGRLLDYFDRHDLWDDTALILTTDHGFLLGEHEWWGKNIPPYFEEISHIPLIMHVPGRGDLAATRTEQTTQTTDLMPTLLDLHGADMPPEVRGRSLLRLVDEPEDRIAVFGQFGGPIGASDGRHALYLYPDRMEESGLHEYTLMPSHLKLPFGTDELAAATLVPPFDFTKGVPLLRVPAAPGQTKRPPGAARELLASFGTMLFDLVADPQQMTPIHCEAAMHRLTAAIVDTLDAHDAPAELYDRFALRSRAT